MHTRHTLHRRRFLGLLAGSATTTTAAAAPGGVGDGGRAWERRAVAFLSGRQSPDGAWRSEIYGGFRDGGALTPLVTGAILSRNATAATAAVAWLRQNIKGCMAAFPVHNASWLLQLAALDARLAHLTTPLVAHLRSLQLGDQLGWPASEPSAGGWGYVGVGTPWRKGIELAPMQQSNLSPTVFAIAGLRAGGVPPDDPAITGAAAFVKRCQNYNYGAGGDTSAPNCQFDDGGFFQMRSDRWRNKAGVAGTTPDGRQRFRSYTAATADGLSGLLFAGVAPDHPRVLAAAAWLAKNPSCDDVPHLRCYSAWTRSRATSMLGGELPGRNPLGPAPLGGAAGTGLSPNTEGALRNPAGELREDDPLVATSLALLAAEEESRGTPPLPRTEGTGCPTP